MSKAKFTLALAAGLLGLLLPAGSASAEASAPQWTISASSLPTNFAPGGDPGGDSYKVFVTNTGSASSEGPVTITDELPAGLVAAAGLAAEDLLTQKGFSEACSENGDGSLSCTFGGAVAPGQTLVLTFPVTVTAPEGSSLMNVIRVTGGGATAAAARVPTSISSSPAPFGIAPGSANTALSSTQAGGHPNITTTVAFNTESSDGATSGALKDFVADEPPGFALDLRDAPVCQAGLFLEEACPTPTQVGIVTVISNIGTGPIKSLRPVYNLAPSQGEVGKLAFNIGQFRYVGDVTLRSSGEAGAYGGRVTFANNTAGGVAVENVSLTVWGVPSDPVHDSLRVTEIDASKGQVGTERKFGAPSNAARVPFFTNPTSCGAEPLATTFSVNSWQEPGTHVHEAMPLGPMVGCDRLTIEPTVETQTTASSAETATGLNFVLGSPQHYENPEGLVASHLDDTTVTLPEGMSLNPSAGSGLGSCTPAQFAYEGSSAEPLFGLGCPNESKIGSVKVHSPALSEEATGSLYVAKPFDNPFGSLLALYLVARIPDRGVVVAAAGEVHADPLTGQLRTTFSENPQLPFDRFTLAFRQGATSPLVTPPVCGHFTADSILTPWSVPSQEHLLASSFDITSGVGGGSCPSGATPPFHPGLIAGSVNNAAGHYSPFYIRLSRQDGEQEITHFSIKLPPGVTGKLAGIPLCSDAQVAQAKAREREQGGAEEEASPSCPAASEVGHTIVEAGVGGTLAQVPGKVYLAGPYHGAPLSVAAITAAKVGPFDLGTVVVREALRVNPETGEVFVDATGSDPLPHIVDGIPTHLREVRIYMDRPEFVLNPTSCEPTSTASTVLGSGKDFVSEADDNPVTVASRFQAADCAALGFKPKIAFSLKGGTRRNQYPAFKAVVQGRPGDANIARSEVVLPKSEILEQAHIGTSCTRVQFNEGAGNGAGCPANSIYGRARATTPILSEPLEGPVYLRSNGGEGGRKVPDLVAALHGQEINIDLVGFIDSVLTKNKRGETVSRIRNRFETVPDAPVTRFTLEMFGGKKGLLVNTTNLCTGTHKAEVDFTAHNGKVEELRPAMRTSCAKKGKGKKHGRK